MTPAAMTAWLAKMGYTRYRAAKELGVTTQTVVNWERGTAPISKVVALACSALSKNLSAWR